MIDAAKVSQVVTWKLEGQSTHLISEAIHGNWSDEDPQQLIDAADKEIEKAGGWDIAAARLVYSRQMEIGEFAAAGRTLKEIERLTKARDAPPTETPPALLIDPKRATSEVNMLGRAVKNGWPISPEIMAQLSDILANVAMTGDSRAKVSAARVLVAMNAQNQKSQPTKKKITHVHKLEPITDDNLEDRRRRIAERLTRISTNAGGPDGAGDVAE